MVKHDRKIGGAVGRMAKHLGRLVKGAASAVGRLFGVVDTPVASVAPVTAAARSGDVGRDKRRASEEKARFVARLRDVVRRNETPTASAFYLINLKSLKSHFGDKWPAIAEKVDAVARRVIEQRISRNDMYLGVAGPMFLVLFEALDEAAARVKSAMIAAEIEAKLLGDGVPGVAVRAGAGRFDPRLVVDPINPQAIAEGFVGSLAGRAAAKAGRPNAAGSASARKGDIPWISTPQRPSEALNEWYQTAKLDLRSVVIEKPEFVYRPMWNVSHQAVSTFHCFAQTSRAHGRPLTYSEPFSALKLDLYTLQRGIRDLKKGFSTGTPFIIGVSVHYSSLIAPQVGETFRTACELVPESFRQRLVCEIMALPECVPSLRLQEAVTVAKRYFRTVNVRLSLVRPDVAAMADSQALAIGADCSAERIDEHKVIGRLNAFAEKAERNGFQSYIHGMNSVSQTVAAMSAGFRYIGGAPVGRGEFPERMYRFMLEDIYSGVMLPEAVPEAVAR